MMNQNETILCTSRYGNPRYLTEISRGNGERCFHVHGNSRYFRGTVLDKDDPNHYIDFEGGPFIQVGSLLLSHDGVPYGTIKSVDTLREGWKKYCGKDDRYAVVEVVVDETELLRSPD